VLVLELADGGEVFERIISKGPFSEASAALVIRQVALALEHLGIHKLVHRDIKPENILYVSSKENSDVKLTDFGLATPIPADGLVTKEVGTVPYMAREMLLGEPYSTPVDVWSLGVCLFTLLSGYLPFDPSGSASPDEQRHRVHSGRPAFSAEDGGHPRQWEQISPSARDLIRHMLCIDPSKRITPAEIVACRWVSGAASAEVLPGSDKQLQRFNAARRIWRTAAGAVALVIGAPATAAAINAEQDTIALDELVANIGEPGLQVPPARAPPTQQLPPAALVEMRAVFRAFDEDGDGYIDERELSAAMQSLGAGEENAEKMLRLLDANADGRIDFDEFCACASPLYKSSTTALRKAFDFFDTDRDGKIDPSELRTILTRLGLAAPHGRKTEDCIDDIIAAIFASADANGDGKVCFDEFIRIFGAAYRHQY